MHYITPTLWNKQTLWHDNIVTTFVACLKHVAMKNNHLFHNFDSILSHVHPCNNYRFLKKTVAGQRVWVI
jgi:hypothetical protein